MSTAVPVVTPQDGGDQTPASVVTIGLWHPVTLDDGRTATALELRRPGFDEPRPDPKTFLTLQDCRSFERVDIAHDRVFRWLQSLSPWRVSELKRIDLQDWWKRIADPVERLIVDPDGPRSSAPPRRPPDDVEMGFTISGTFHRLRRPTLRDLLDVGEVQYLRIANRHVHVCDDERRVRSMAARLLGISSITLAAIQPDVLEEILRLTRVVAYRDQSNWGAFIR